MEPYCSSFELVQCKQSGFVRTIVDPIPNGSKHIRARVNAASDFLPLLLNKQLEFVLSHFKL